MKKMIAAVILTAQVSLLANTSQADNIHYKVGAAKSDITGPFVASSTGYNSPGDEMSGLAMRLYSRAFVIEQPGKSIIAIATTDQILMYQSIKLGVVKQLQNAGYGNIFSAANVMVTATHTHAASSNTSWYTLFNLFNGIMGFDQLHYEVVVEGVTRSIINAYEARRDATIKMATGLVHNAAFNRSVLAYQQNFDAINFDSTTEERMWLMRFDGVDGQEIGLLNWFAVHGTSLGIDNRRIHGDNKGWAAYTFEKMKGKGFVAAFAQGAMGDVSPNHPQPEDVTLPFQRPSDLDPSLDPMENPIVAGSAQYAAAASLYDEASKSLPVTLDYRHTYVNFNHLAVKDEYIHSYRMPWDTEPVADRSTCIGVVGAGFLAGDEEGAPVDFAAEGEIRNNYTLENGEWVQNKYDFNELEGDGLAGALGALWPLASAALRTDKYDACHKEKFALLPVGKVDDFWFPNPEVPFVPVIIPLQIFRIGSSVLVGTPFEMTTMTGRRLKSTVENRLLGNGVDEVILAGMANSYGQYLTTREEYAAQHYEGGFTIYGPWASAAVAQELDRLATDLVEGTPTASSSTPPDLSSQQFIETWISSNGVVTDGGEFGQVLSDVGSTYSSTSDTVAVQFRAAHPRTILEKKIDGSLDRYYNPNTYSFLEIQKKDLDQWITVATDGDPYTSFDWQREGGSSSLSDKSTATVTWLVRNQEPGTYRIKYNGLAKRWLFITTIYEPFVGFSSEFQLQ